MKKNKIRILSTKVLEQQLVHQLEDQGIAAESIAFIGIKSRPEPELKKEIALLSNQKKIVVFTSVHAVETVSTSLNNKRPSWQIFCLGSATRKIVSEVFGPESIVGSADTANALADLMVEQNTVGEVLFFCGNWRREELPLHLANHQIEVREIIVYETTLTPYAVSVIYNGILFFSPSGVKSFFSFNQPEPETALFAIGHTTANEIKKYSDNKVVVSDKPTTVNLMSTVIKFFRSHALPIDHPQST
jgi:uroporphyrinogen-III synthase